MVSKHIVCLIEVQLVLRDPIVPIVVNNALNSHARWASSGDSPRFLSIERFGKCCYEPISKIRLRFDHHEAGVEIYRVLRARIAVGDNGRHMRFHEKVIDVPYHEHVAVEKDDLLKFTSREYEQLLKDAGPMP